MKHQLAIMTGCVLCFFIVAAGGCSKNAEKNLTSEAVKVAESWLGVVDRGEFGKSWDQSAELFQAAVSRDEWEQSLKISRTSFGKMKSRSVKSAQFSTSLPRAPDGEYVVIQFTSSFSNKESAIETVTPMKDPDGVWRVSGYYVK